MVAYPGLGQGKKSKYEVKFMKFPAPPESTRAIETTLEGQPSSDMGTRKCLAENYDNGILTPTLG